MCIRDRPHEVRRLHEHGIPWLHATLQLSQHLGDAVRPHDLFGVHAGALGAVGNALRQLSHADERVERHCRRRLADALVTGGRKVA